MPIVKDNNLAIKKYHAITDLVIFAMFIIANAFVIAGAMKVGFFANYDNNFANSEEVLFKFAKSYPGLLCVYHSFCAPGFYILNNFAHDILAVVKLLLEFIQMNFASKDEIKVYEQMINSITGAMKVSNNFVLYFGKSQTEVYAIGEIIIALTALIYGWITRQIVSLFAFVFN